MRGTIKHTTSIPLLVITCPMRFSECRKLGRCRWEQVLVEASPLGESWLNVIIPTHCPQHGSVQRGGHLKVETWPRLQECGDIRHLCLSPSESQNTRLCVDYDAAVLSVCTPSITRDLDWQRFFSLLRISISLICRHMLPTKCTEYQRKDITGLKYHL